MLRLLPIIPAQGKWRWRVIWDPRPTYAMSDRRPCLKQKQHLRRKSDCPETTQQRSSKFYYSLNAGKKECGCAYYTKNAVEYEAYVLYSITQKNHPHALYILQH